MDFIRCHLIRLILDMPEDEVLTVNAFLSAYLSGFGAGVI